MALSPNVKTPCSPCVIVHFTRQPSDGGAYASDHWTSRIDSRAGAAVWPLSARAQEGGRKYTIGIFSAGSEHAEIPALTAAFFEALRELGWVEGKNVAFEHR